MLEVNLRLSSGPVGHIMKLVMALFTYVAPEQRFSECGACARII